MQPVINPEQQAILNLQEQVQFAENGIVSRTLLQTPNGRVVVFGFDQGQEMSEHTSTSHALIQMLSGECELSLGPDIHHVKAGDLIYMPPNLPHALKATTRFSLLLTLYKPGEQNILGKALPSLGAEPQ